MKRKHLNVDLMQLPIVANKQAYCHALECTHVPRHYNFFTQEPEEAQEEEAHANKLRANSVIEKYVWNIFPPMTSYVTPQICPSHDYRTYHHSSWRRREEMDHRTMVMKKVILR